MRTVASALPRRSSARPPSLPSSRPLLLLFVTVTAVLSCVTADVGKDRQVSDTRAEGRGKMKDMMMSPMMLIPQLIALGFAPVVLANLKMMIMSAMMINNMALNAAIFMTIRDFVFGPKPGPSVKYVNYGYGGHARHTHRRRRRRRDANAARRQT
ncbi:uncharacterized protein LOC126835523 [Adelges cooleyi]|uniref:uncharacterized protein LOC126835523 n=1 Tax=Adelges cooleyi TaxID=133065 RepID=UPI0021806E66|nr:uncharacterized protein LOC126835523 [Adelges cooleyi]